tara:strand:+ start:336 stop:1349 length:1014 start_codon:yes stop_codon:yes gene_type:complete
VSWNGHKSSKFEISNGVRQGAVLSPTLFNLYIDGLFSRLNDSGCGSRIEELFYGAWGYADDIGLVAPSRDSLQQMINICQQFFQEHGIHISVNPDINKTKTKLIFFGVEGECLPLCLGSRPLPVVKQWEHLGVLISSDESTDHDLALKKGAFIGKVHNLQQELGKQDPGVFIKLVKIYLLHLYGSSLWDIFDGGSTQMWTAWHKLLKITFNLPLPTHRHLLNELVECDHPKKLVIKRFVKFSSNLANSNNLHIRRLHNLQKADMRSCYGRNIRNICRQARVNDISLVDFSDIIINPVPEGEEWRADMMRALLVERESPRGFLSELEVCQMLTAVCCD